jgi:hypothetical protein
LIDELCAQSTDPENMRFLLTVPELPRSVPNARRGLHPLPSQVAARHGNEIFKSIERRGENADIAPRAAFAAAVANRDTYLTVGQHAIHLCSTEIRDDIRMCCINPSHIVGS